jgi:hypothetical protein
MVKQPPPDLDLEILHSGKALTASLVIADSPIVAPMLIMLIISKSIDMSGVSA